MDILQQWKYFSTHCVVWSVYSFLRLLCTSFCPTKICYGFYVACLVIPKISLTLHWGCENITRKKKSFLFSLQEYYVLVWGVYEDGFRWLDVFLLKFFFITSNARSHTYWSVFTQIKSKQKNLLSTTISLAIFTKDFLWIHEGKKVLICDTCIDIIHKAFQKKLKINKIKFQYTDLVHSMDETNQREFIRFLYRIY